MKCLCSECSGRGYVPCEGCDGAGEITAPLLEFRIGEGQPGFDTVRECQQAARQVVRQADMLSDIFPANREKYREQMTAILAELDAEATLATQKKGAA